MNGIAKSRKLSFSLRILFFVVTLLGCGFAFYAFRLNQLRQHHEAIAQLRAAGARPMTTLANFASVPGQKLKDGVVLKPTFAAVLLGRPVMCIRHVDLSDPSITTDILRDMEPRLLKLIPFRSDDPDNPRVLLDVGDNPNVSCDFIRKMQDRLPNVQFLQQEYRD